MQINLKKNKQKMNEILTSNIKNFKNILYIWKLYIITSYKKINKHFICIGFFSMLNLDVNILFRLTMNRGEHVHLDWPEH